jgi:NADH-quinone oxidoreductase subunit M
MLANITVVLPFLIAVLCMLIPKNSLRFFSVLGALASLAIGVFAYLSYTNDANSPLLTSTIPWIKSINAQWTLEIDGMSLIMVLLTSIVSLLIFLSTKKEYSRGFYALAWSMIGAMLGVFTARDGLLFYVFWELALIPIYFICLLWGGEGRGKIAFKFFLYTLAGSLFMLAGFIYLYYKAGGSWQLSSMYEAGRLLSSGEQNLVFWAIFVGFAIKMPIFPFHTWQADTYAVAPAQGTMLLSGIMLKMGVYGAIRWLIPMVPAGVAANAKIVMILSIIGIIFASLVALVQKDFKRLLAWSSVAHIGLIAAGIFSMSPDGLKGAFVQMLAHGINVVGLFYIADIILDRTKTQDIKSLGGIRAVAPQFAFFFLIIMLASIALPLTNGFIGEFLLLNGVFQYNFWMAVFAGLTVVLGAVYMLRVYQAIMLGEHNSLTSSFMDISNAEKINLILITILIFAFGLFPNIILNIVNPSIDALVNNNLSIK